MVNMIQALFIDPELKEVKTVGLTEKDNDIDLEECYKLLNCDLVEFVYFGENEILIVDEEGLLKMLENEPFMLKGVGQELFMGKALIVQENGEYCGSLDTEKIAELKSKISFPIIEVLDDGVRLSSPIMVEDGSL